MEIIINLNEYDAVDSFYDRKAVRAVIKEQGKYLMIKEPGGDYKFPGGGIEAGEDSLSALCREVMEETGGNLKRDSVCLMGNVLEVRQSKEAFRLIMDSEYYFCRLKDNNVMLKGEKGRKPEWVELKQAISCCENNPNLVDCPWIIREIKVMKYLLEKEEYNEQ